MLKKDKDNDDNDKTGNGGTGGSGWDWNANKENYEKGQGANNQNAVVEGVVTFAKGASVVGAGYVAYRLVRMIPSLFPGLWWTIPANVALP